MVIPYYTLFFSGRSELVHLAPDALDVLPRQRLGAPRRLLRVPQQIRRVEHRNEPLALVLVPPSPALGDGEAGVRGADAAEDGLGRRPADEHDDVGVDEPDLLRPC